MIIKKFLSIIFFMTILATSSLYYFLIIDSYNGPDYQIHIASGMPFSKINSLLLSEGIIKHPGVFHKYAKLAQKITKLKAGDYIIPSGSNIIDILEILTSSKQILLKITIPEGKNLYQIAQIFAIHEITSYTEFVENAKNHIFLKEIGVDYPTVEGFLYPETYHFPMKTSAKEIIKKMVREFNKNARPLLENHSIYSPYDLLILASIVEKETGLGEERALIAGVFFNRLNKKMRLQSDPTTIYGIWENFSGNLKKSHLREKTPYNTYQIKSLPIGPICNPGKHSLEAVINPSKHNYFYFVSRNDGSHEFTMNYKDHQKKVYEFQIQKRR